MPSITVWKCSSRQAIRGDHGPQRERHRMLRRAGEHGADLLAPPGELRAGELGIGDFVDDVVDFAAERVERGDRAPPLRRQEQEAVVEARAALRRPLLAVFVGRHAAPPGRASRWRRGGNTRVARDARPVGARKLRPPAEDVAARRVDAVEDAMAAGEHAGQLQPQPPRQRARERTSGLEHRARARRFEGHQRAPRIVAARVGDVRFGDAEAREILAGKIDAALLPVGGDVLPEVDELQRRADRVARARVRRAIRRRRGGASAGRSGLAERRQ